MRTLIQAAAKFLNRYRHINWAVADQIMVSGVNFLTGILLARYLGIAEFGRFTLAWLVILFVNSLQHAMINSPMMSIGPMQPRAELRAYYGAVMVQQAAFGVLTFLAMFVGVRLSGLVFPSWNIETLALPLATTGLALQIQDFLRRYFFTRLRSRAAFVNDAVRYLGQFAMLVALFVFSGAQMDIASTLWVIALTAGVAAAGCSVFVERPQLDATSLCTTARRHWHFSKWLVASGLLQWMSGSLFFLAAGGLLGAYAVGALRAAQNLIGVVHILFMALENVGPVRAAAHFRDGGKRALLSYLGQVTVWGSSITVFAALTLMVAPTFWMTLVFGEAYAEHSGLVLWYSVIYVLVSLEIPLRIGLRTIEYLKPLFLGYLGMSIFALVASYPVVWWQGLNGAAAGLLLAQIVMLIIVGKGFRTRLMKRSTKPWDTTS